MVLTRRRSGCGVVFLVNGIGSGFLREGFVGATHFSEKCGVVSEGSFDPEMVFAHRVLREGDGPLKQRIGFFILSCGEIQ